MNFVPVEPRLLGCYYGVVIVLHDAKGVGLDFTVRVGLGLVFDSQKNLGLTLRQSKKKSLRQIT